MVPLWSPALQDRKWATTPSLSSGKGEDADDREGGTVDRVYLGEILSRECHLSQQKGVRSELGRVREKPDIWIIDKMTIRPKVLVGYEHKHCLPQGQ